MPISSVSEIINDLRLGRMVVLMDDEDRENEGDLLMAAEYVRPEDINFMARYGRGLVCLTLDQSRCRQLQLPLMVNHTHARQVTNFTVSIEAAQGVTTGISAADRAVTIRAAVKKDAKPDDVVQPGHVFPLMAQAGGVLARAGHTEAGVDLARLAGLEPASVICEILNEDGTMARLPQLESFATEHSLKVGTIADLIRYRLEMESTIKRVGDSRVPTEFGDFRVLAYHDEVGGRAHLALIKGEVTPGQPTLVRVHVQESLFDSFTSAHRDGYWTLHAAMKRVTQEGTGIVVILNQEGGAQDLVQRLQYFLNPEKRVIVPVRKRGREELRTYGLGSQILADLGVSKIRVLGHAIKTPGLSGFGLEIVEYIEDDQQNRECNDKKVSG
jgi:3,4-dihydroxy 2-butanone 4-phosphate synthase/GTP cyclohydrolase II